MLRWRLVLGTLLTAGFVGLCWLDARARVPGAWLFPLALVGTGLACQEILSLAKLRNLRPLAWVVYGGNLLVVASNWYGHLWGERWPLDQFCWPAAALAVGMMAVFLSEMQRFSAPGGVTERVAVGVLALTYVGLLMSFVVQLRFLGSSGFELGIPALASLFIVVKFGDIGAYTVGRLFGRTRMAPALSPGKTIEGACGGFAFACGGSALTFLVILPGMVPQAAPVDAWRWLAFGVVVGAAGMVGDLAESLLKRDLGRKDSSRWMPGFGGVLDILDSLLMAAPIAYLCWKFRLVGG